MAVKIANADPVFMAREYLKRGIAITPLNPGTKRPRNKNWVQDFIKANPQTGEDLDLADVFQQYNIGIVLGYDSSGLTDIDLDSEESVALAKHFLPKTSWVFGRKSNPNSHYMYVSAKSQTIKYISPVKDEGVILEIRSDGAQTMAPGSTHPDGEVVEFTQPVWRRLAPTIVDFPELSEACGRLAAASMILRHGWQDGKRDELCVALTGVLLRSEWTTQEVDDFMTAIAMAAGDEELDERLKAEYQKKRLEGDHRVPGIPRLKEIMGDQVAEKVVEWLGLKAGNVIEELNKKIAFVVVGSKSRIILTDRGEPTFLTIPDAKTALANLGYVKSGKLKVPKFNYWLESPHRREYDGVTFDPSPEPNPRQFNFWRGWELTGVMNKAGCQRFLDHILEVICSGDPDLYEYVISWMADIIQNPHIKPGVCMVLKGGKGTGKTIVGDYLSRVVGSYSTVVTNHQHLFGKHNTIIQGKLLILADDAFWSGDRHAERAFKTLITNEKVSIEPKGIGSFEIRNLSRIFLTTNDSWAVPAGTEERRYCVIGVKDHRVDDHDYFAQLVEEMNNGGPACLMGFLQGWRIKKNLKVIPVTTALLESQLSTLSFHEDYSNWWFSRLQDGNTLSSLDNWEPIIYLKDLYWDFLKFSGKTKFKADRSAQIRFGIEMQRLCRTFTRGRKRRVNYESPYQGTNAQCYEFKSLEECREDFATRILKTDSELIWNI